MKYTVEESEKFATDLEDAVTWLYLHNLEQSQEFADRKSLELRQEIADLAHHLNRTPYMGQADPISKLRRFPLYEGRFLATWTVDERTGRIILLEFIDSKYPQNLRQFTFDD